MLIIKRQDALKFETSMSYDKRDIINPQLLMWELDILILGFGLCIIKMVRLMIHLVVTGILLVG